MNVLCDVWVSPELGGANTQLHGFGQEIRGQLLYLLRPGGGPHQGLALSLYTGEQVSYWLQIQASFCLLRPGGRPHQGPALSQYTREQISY